MNRLLPLLVLLGGCVPQQTDFPDNPWRIEPGTRPMIIAHGGAKDLWPENTLTAFDGAAALGVDALEMDVNLTADGYLVTLHDLTIDATSEGSGTTIDLTFEELQAYNFGYEFRDTAGGYPYRNNPVRIPRLEEVFARYPEARFVVELKNPGADGRRAAEILKSLIETYGVEDQILVASFHDEVLDYFYEITSGRIAISSAEDETEDFVFTGLSGMEFMYRPDAEVVAIPTSSAGIPLDAPRIIRSAHRRNMAVQYWTINDPAEMKQLIQTGADGLITDRPDLMHQVLKELGLE
ncbi:MAG: glycerophosphodiester phosphodiesterase [Bacteroidia bacterium]|nr:glycerophosphodiester phosphodiesterase [Bacteroidia bacterium]